MTPLSSARLVVVKVGSALLVDQATGALKRDWLKGLCADIAALKRDGKSVIIVSSGAIALGRHALKLKVLVVRAAHCGVSLFPNDRSLRPLIHCGWEGLPVRSFLCQERW